MLGLLSLGLLSAAAWAGDADDYHVSGDPAQRLFRLSPFAHGYIHGYEGGFGMGDDDVHMARTEEKIDQTEEYHHADRGYDRSFGDRENFRAGFREGLTMGYHDAISGGEFRALGELRRLATGLENELVGRDPVNHASDAGYDGGFLAGYRAARQEHPNECKAGVAAGKTDPSKARFCSGFLDGYELGESDLGDIASAQKPPAPPMSANAGVTRHSPRR